MLQRWGADLRDPKDQGNVMLGAGVVLIADGLVGIQHPFGGKKSRAGIFGSVFIMAFSALFFIVCLYF